MTLELSLHCSSARSAYTSLSVGSPVNEHVASHPAESHVHTFVTCFRVEGLGLGFMVRVSGFQGLGLGCRVQGPGLRVEG